MKLFLLKTLLQRRDRDEGFTLPMVIALGLVMILLGLTNIVKSGEENVNSIAQSQRVDAFAVAELGAAQYRQFFDRNRALILHNRNRWTSITDVCETITDTANGWANDDYDGQPANLAFNTASGPEGQDYWRSITLNEVQLGRDLNGDTDATDTDAAINIGSYKIVDYEFDLDGTTGDTDTSTTGIQYDTNDDTLFDQTNDNENDIDSPPDGESDARGILTIKARTPDGSETQIEYEIPVRINEGDLDNLAPALWINQNNITTAKLGNLEINGGNLVVSHRFTNDNTANDTVTWNINSPATNVEPCQDPPDITIGTNTISVESDPRGVPDLTRIQNFYSTLAVGSENNYISGTRMGSTGDNEFDDGDPDNDPIFYYEVNLANTPLAVGNDIQTDGIADVILYVPGDITIDTPAGGTRNIGFEPTIIDYTSPNLQILSTGNITINTNGGKVNITGLIHAPNGTLTINGTGTVNIVGSVWVNDFDNSAGATVTVEPDWINTKDGRKDSYNYYRVAGDRDAKPITQPPTNWKTE